MASTTTNAKKKLAEIDKIKAVWAEIQSHDKSALFSSVAAAAPGSHNPDLQMSLDVVKHKMDNHLYDKRPRDFVQDMQSVFTVDSDSALASAASSFKILFQCLLDKHSVDLGRSTKRHKRGSSNNASKRSKQSSTEVFDFVFEEELSSGFLFEGDQFLSSGSGDDLFGKDDDDSSTEDFVPLSFSFEQESVLDGRSPLYSGILDSAYSSFDDDGWAEWDDSVSSPKSTEEDDADDEENSGDSSHPDSPVTSSTAVVVASPATSTTTTTQTSESEAVAVVSKRSKRQRTPSMRGLPMRWTKEDLLFKITNELPSEKLEGIIMIVNPALEFGSESEDEDLEFDINALDEATLYRLQEYVHACLSGEDDQGNESMLETQGIITITRTITEETSPRKKTRTKAKSQTSSNPRKTAATPTKKTTRSPQRRKSASPAKTRSPTATSKTKKAPRAAASTQVIETTICHFVEQDEHFNYIPHGRGARLNALVPEAFEVFRTEQVIKVQKSASDSDMEEEVDII